MPIHAFMFLAGCVFMSGALMTDLPVVFGLGLMFSVFGGRALFSED